MITQNQLERAKKLLSPWAVAATHPQPNRVDLEISAVDLLAAVKSLVDAGWGYLVAISGVDPGVETGALWVLYHFAEDAAVATLRVVVPRLDPMVPTIRHIVALAGIYEQELTEILGVIIDGADDNGRLFLPDDWPDGVFPLRKDFLPASIEI
jgi:Ni,Fe-hydrogenase III component G